MRPSENEQRGLRFGIFCISVVLAIAAIFGMKAGLKSLILAADSAMRWQNRVDALLPKGAVQFVVLDGIGRRIGPDDNPTEWEQRVIDDPDEVQRLLELLQDGINNEVLSTYPTAQLEDGDSTRRVGFTTDASHLTLELLLRDGSVYIYPAHNFQNACRLTDEAAQEILAYFADHPERDLTDAEEYDAIRLIDPTDGTIYNVREDEFATVGAALDRAVDCARETKNTFDMDEIMNVLVAEVRVKFFDSGELFIGYERLNTGCRLFVCAQSALEAPLGMFLEDMDGREMTVYEIGSENDPFAAILDQYLDIAGYGD